MNWIKLSLLSAVGIIGLLLLVAAFLPAEYTVKRSVEIERPADVVFDKVSNFESWPEWSPWSDIDPQAEMVYDGAAGLEGSSWSWKGEAMGSGKITILKIVPNRSIHSRLVFHEPNTMVADDVWTFQWRPERNATLVTWTNKGNLSYPLGRYMGLFMEDMMGPDFEKGLSSLKRLLESS